MEQINLYNTKSSCKKKEQREYLKLSQLPKINEWNRCLECGVRRRALKKERCAGGTYLYTTNRSESKAIFWEENMYSDHLRGGN